MKARLETGWVTRRGRQASVNQDRLGWYIPQDPTTWASKGALFVIADGMGSHAAGHLAGQLAVQWVLYSYYADPSPDPSRSLQAAIEIADRWLGYWAAVRPDLRGMGTTLTALAVCNGELIVAHVGDSRAYLVRQNRAWLLTRDHTWVARAITDGLLTPMEARQHPWRNVLVRSLNGSGAAVDVQRVLLVEGDRLVLLTDGVSDSLQQPEVAWLASYSPRRAARKLADLARRRGNQDDATVLVVSLGKAARKPQPALGPAWQPAPVSATPTPPPVGLLVTRTWAGWLMTALLGIVSLGLLFLVALAK